MPPRTSILEESFEPPDSDDAVFSTEAIDTTLPEPPALPLDIRPRRHQPWNEIPIRGGYINPARSTYDGRLLARTCTKWHDPDVCFGINKIESVTQDFRSSTFDLGRVCAQSQCKISADQMREAIEVAEVPAPGTLWHAKFDHYAICDAPSGAPSGPVLPPHLPHPVRCADSDCYDLKIIMPMERAAPIMEGTNIVGWGPELDSALWSIQMRIVVQNPKTPQAAITSVSYSNARRVGIPRAEARDLIEPTITGDGHMMLWHSGRKLKYSYNDLGACNPAGWTTAKEISELYADSRLRTGGVARYGIAAFPIRDPNNRLVSKINPGDPVTEIGGSYPWVDRNGNNFFWLIGGRSLFYIDDTTGDLLPLYPGVKQATCSGTACDTGNLVNVTPPDCMSLPEADRPACYSEFRGQAEAGAAGRTGFVFFGSWSNGKIVVLDNRLNNHNFAIAYRGPDPDGKTDRWVNLYRNQWIRLGESESTMLNSPESQFNIRRFFRPARGEDVVWPIFADIGGDSLAFDPYFDQATLIYSPMIASMDPANTALHERMYKDGFQPTGTPDNVLKGRGFTRDPKIHNAATTPKSILEVPEWGVLKGGARAEPVAAGGVQSRGLYLDGDNDYLQYVVPVQPAGASSLLAGTWTYSLWVDPRTSPAQANPRILFKTSDNTIVSFWANGIKVAKGALNAQFDLNERAPNAHHFFGAGGKWTHISLVSTPEAGSQTRIRFYLDGLLFGERVVAGSLLRVGQGNVYLGGGDASLGGFHGWLDEFRVIARESNPEVMCGYAHGTLMGVPQTDSARMSFLGIYGDPAANQINSFLLAKGKSTHHRFVCESEFAGAFQRASLSQLCRPHLPTFITAPEASRCVHGDMLFPEGPLFWEVPRPESRPNLFCLTCHLDGHPDPQLQLVDPLKRISALLKKDDDRRQPFEPSRLIYGQLPNEVFGRPVPQDSGSGVNVDEIIYPPNSTTTSTSTSTTSRSTTSTTSRSTTSSSTTSRTSTTTRSTTTTTLEPGPGPQTQSGDRSPASAIKPKMPSIGGCGTVTKSQGPSSFGGFYMLLIPMVVAFGLRRRQRFSQNA